MASNSLDKSLISDPAHLAYIWIVYLDVVAKRNDWIKIIHRTDRCDLGLFRLGLALIEHFLN